ncbi:tRNA (adenosine(37)-N6)-threonylcarbamoyltransferase complex dimerization subunit type 1 TsaB [Cognatishimia sp. WU-CL00825]|uniref:tRNA (adenosine(37)-N6)-threonylcarbamoyltransferase complex dimerization subunit type 1 TsaB n=1 Tax=Cognatishimia sp. WU-CL00825 TaxID=3127658 RepID=UPI0033658162
MSDPIVLSFDTSAAHCAAALLRAGTILHSRVLEMGRGQAEALMPMLEKLLEQQNLTWTDLDAIGVGTGPGNFTGIRISVSAARGLALALKIPAIGVSTFEATRLGSTDETITAVSAPRDQLYISDPKLGSKPILVSAPYPTDRPIKMALPAAQLAENIGHVAVSRIHFPPERPAPLYIRAADAAPSRDAPPTIL